MDSEVAVGGPREGRGQGACSYCGVVGGLVGSLQGLPFRVIHTYTHTLME